MSHSCKKQKQPIKQNMYPQIDIHLNRLQHNAQHISKICRNHNIHVCGIVKGANGDPLVAKSLIMGGCSQIGDSRLHHLKDLKEHGIKAPLLLTRIPMLSEVEMLVKYADISLNSEIEAIRAINDEAIIQNRIHKVILMCDLGDLREGCFDQDELFKCAKTIESLSHVELYGIGTNLGCYGSVEPTIDNMNQLVSIVEETESLIGRQIEVISGGATSTLPLVINDQIPDRINHLRIGECILLGKDLDAYWGLDMSVLHQDTFILKAELIEVKSKPTHPIGKLFVDAFGERPHYEDRGVRKRGILAIGKQDFVYHDKLIPIDPNIEIVGSSSDHLIIDMEATNQSYKLGDVVSFKMFYGPMLYLTGSNSVSKSYITS